jgi:hypothetical protein
MEILLYLDLYMLNHLDNHHILLVLVCLGH